MTSRLGTGKSITFFYSAEQQLFESDEVLEKLSGAWKTSNQILQVVRSLCLISLKYHLNGIEVNFGAFKCIKFCVRSTIVKVLWFC